MSNTLGTTMSSDLKPYIGRASGTAIWKCDTTDLDDGGTDFQAYVKSRPILTMGELGHKVGLEEPLMLAKALSGVTITLTTDRDFGLETRTHTQLLTASASETRVFKKFEGGGVGEADVVQVQNQLNQPEELNQQPEVELQPEEPNQQPEVELQLEELNQQPVHQEQQDQQPQRNQQTSKLLNINKYLLQQFDAFITFF